MSKKYICISGASSGIGAACALRFAKEGQHLIIGARREDKLRKVADECKNLGAASVSALPLDVSSDASVAGFVKRVLEQCPKGPDVLLNNAGLALGTSHIKDGDIAEFQKVIDVNVTGVLRLTRALLPAMVEAERGHLVFLSSIAAHQVYEGGAVYAGTKHMLRAMIQTLKLELNGKNIRISSIDPGMVETEFSEVRFAGDKEKAKGVYRGMKPLTGEDIADSIAYVVNAPAHVNIDQMIITPVDQASVYKVHRR